MAAFIDVVRRTPLLGPALVLLRRLVGTLHTGQTVLRLWVADRLLPSSYFVQIQPKYARSHPEVVREQSDYDRGHDWPQMRDGVRVLQVRMLLDRAGTLSEGDYGEVGTYQGNLARLIYRYKVPEATLFCFDTFEGFDQRDLDLERETSGVDATVGQFGDTNQERVRERITGSSAGRADLRLRKGFFPDTFAGLEDRTWRFVVLDPDLYGPVKHGLELFWPRLVPGGIILIDDCVASYYRGVDMAVREFCEPRNIPVVPVADCSGGAVIVKPGG